MLPCQKTVTIRAFRESDQKYFEICCLFFLKLWCAYCTFFLVNDLQGKTGVLWLILLGKFDFKCTTGKMISRADYFLNSIVADCKGLVTIHHRALGQSIGLHLWLSKAWAYIYEDDIWRCRIVISLIESSILLWLISVLSAFLSFCNFSMLSG